MLKISSGVMDKFGECEKAASSVVGIVLLAGMTVVMVSTIALSVLAFEPPGPAPEARIVAGDVMGGLPNSVRFEENTIELNHKGGDNLDLKKTKIMIQGPGRSHRKFGDDYVPPSPAVGDVQVIYLNLIRSGKISEYNRNNTQLLKDGYWSAGESLLLTGADSINATDAYSSVWVSVNGDGNTSNNYGFKEGEKIYINVIDTVTNQIISTTFATVKKA